MSKLRFNITMSLDGFVAGPNQSEENPLGVGGEAAARVGVRLAAWREAHGMEGGEVNESTPVVEGWPRTSARRSWAGTCSAAAPAPGARTRGTAGGATIRPSTTRSSCSPTTRASRWSCRAARRSTSSPTGSSPRSSRPGGRGRQGRSLGGGANVAQQYLAAGLIDEIEISRRPAAARRGRTAVRQPRRRRVELEQVRGDRGAGRHPPQVPGRRERRSQPSTRVRAAAAYDSRSRTPFG